MTLSSRTFNLLGFDVGPWRVDTGVASADLDDMQPGRTAFETFEKRVSRVVEWKKDPEKFLRDLGEESDDAICSAVQEEFKLER